MLSAVRPAKLSGLPIPDASGFPIVPFSYKSKLSGPPIGPVPLSRSVPLSRCGMVPD
jgi:hypothetical protein